MMLVPGDYTAIDVNMNGSEQTDPLNTQFTGNHLLDGSSDNPLRTIHNWLFDIIQVKILLFIPPFLPYSRLTIIPSCGFSNVKRNIRFISFIPLVSFARIVWNVDYWERVTHPIIIFIV